VTICKPQVEKAELVEEVRRLEEDYYQTIIRFPSWNWPLNWCHYTVSTTAKHALSHLKRPEETRQADAKKTHSSSGLSRS